MTARANDPAGDKSAWRRRLLAARKALPPEARTARDRALRASAVELARSLGAGPSPAGAATPDGSGVASLPREARRGPVCAYLPIGTEPGGSGLPDALANAGVEVWLPVVPATPGPLDWAPHDGGVAPGPLGLREPTGARLGPSAIARAALVLVPALAVDRRGVRLGRGGGFYDRTLPLATGLLVALLGDGELVDELPADPHDRPVAAVLLPGAGLVTLGKLP